MIYAFANCMLDSRVRQLKVAGETVHVEPQVFDVLQYLVENRDRVVSRDELIDVVWQGRSVSEATISARIWAARHAVGDTGEAQGVIQTLPRRGFRFVASVTAVGQGNDEAARGAQQRPLDLGAENGGQEPNAAPPSGSATTGGGRLKLAIAAAAVVLVVIGAGVVSWWQLGQTRLAPASVERMAFPLPDKPSLAVLPFANLSSDAARDFMGEGLSESLTNALARNPYLFIIANSSTSIYAEQSITPKQAAEELGVRYIVDGSVKRNDGRVRVMAQLVDAVGGRVLWSERYQRPADDLLALDEEITARIARSLHVRIVYGSEQSEGGTRSLDAWAAYVQGRTEYLKFTEAGVDRAQELYKRALEADPNYAEAMVALAYTHLVVLPARPEEDWPRVLARIEQLERQVAEIAPRMPRLFELRSMLALTQGDFDRALAEAEAMVETDPNGAESHYAVGRMYFFAGQYQRAIDSLTAAVRMNPHNSATYFSHLAFSQLALGRTDAAISTLQTARERWPDYAPAHVYLAIAYKLAGRDAKARRQVATLPELAPHITMPAVERRFSPMQDRQVHDRIIAAAQEAGISD